MNEIQETDRQLINQIAAHFRHVQEMTNGLNFLKFASDENNVKAVADQVAKVGAAARAVSPEFKAHFNSIAWDSLIDLEAAITDEDGPSAEITWGIVQEDMPYLAATIDQVLDFLENSDGDALEE